MRIKEVLKDLGLNSKEISVYLNTLELGVTSVTQIAEKTGIKRTSVYDILHSLSQMNLTSRIVKDGRGRFYAEDPIKLEERIKEKAEKLDKIMPELRGLINTAGQKPKLKFYDGMEGIKDVYRDTLKYKGELLAFVTDLFPEKIGQEFSNEYTKRRMRNKIFAKVIGPDTEIVKEYKKRDGKEYKKTKLVSSDKFPFSVEMNIYGNKVAFMSFKEEMGVIIESSEITQNLKFLFELAWKGV